MDEKTRELFVKKLRLITFTGLRSRELPNRQRQPNHPANVRLDDA